jgi:hypothetical protein
VPQHNPDLPPELRPLAQMPLLKRLAARLFGRVDAPARTASLPSWLQGQADGFRSGHRPGWITAIRRAMRDGLEEGRQVLFISDIRPRSCVPRAWTTTCSMTGACR